MPVTQSIQVEWAQQGDVNWESSWIARHGHERTHTPGEDEHIGFANYDLRLNDLPQITRAADGGLEIIFDAVAVSGYPPNAGALVLNRVAAERLVAVIERHGFRARRLAS